MCGVQPPALVVASIRTSTEGVQATRRGSESSGASNGSSGRTLESSSHLLSMSRMSCSRSLLLSGRRLASTGTGKTSCRHSAVARVKSSPAWLTVVPLAWLERMGIPSESFGVLIVTTSRLPRVSTPSAVLRTMCILSLSTCVRRSTTRWTCAARSYVL